MELSDVKAALERGSGVVLVEPPAPEQSGLWDLLPPGGPDGPGAVIVCADQTAALDWVAAAPPGRSVHAVTGLARTARLLKTGTLDVVAAAVPDLAALVTQAAFKLGALPIVALAWPEALVAGEHARALDELLAEAANARRIVLSWDPSALTGFLERHAHRAPISGELPVDADGRRALPVAAARYAIATPDRRLSVLRGVLDAVNPSSVVVWTPDDRHASRLRDTLGALRGSVVTHVPEDKAELVVCARVPSRIAFAELARAGPVVVLAAPYQLPYLRFIAAPLDALRLRGAADRGQDRVTALRDRIAARLGRGDVDAELGMLAPLLERFDPAEVAAALLALQREHTPEAAVPATPGGGTAPPQWVKVFVNVGRKDGAAAKDLVGAMTRELAVAKADIGRVEVRDSFSLIDVSAPLSESVLRGLSRVTIRGKRVTAKLDQQR